MTKFTFKFCLRGNARTQAAVHNSPALAMQWILLTFPELRSWYVNSWQACPGKHRSGPFSAF